MDGAEGGGIKKARKLFNAIQMPDDIEGDPFAVV